MKLRELELILDQLLLEVSLSLFKFDECSIVRFSKAFLVEVVDMVFIENDYYEGEDAGTNFTRLGEELLSFYIVEDPCNNAQDNSNRVE